MDEQKYKKRLEELFASFESICRRCGKCCGLDNDPCVNLSPGNGGKYYCRVYDTRFGPQKTVSGKVLNCVTLRENIKKGFDNPTCAYIKC